MEKERLSTWQLYDATGNKTSFIETESGLLKEFYDIILWDGVGFVKLNTNDQYFRFFDIFGNISEEEYEYVDVYSVGKLDAKQKKTLLKNVNGGVGFAIAKNVRTKKITYIDLIGRTSDSPTLSGFQLHQFVMQDAIELFDICKDFFADDNFCKLVKRKIEIMFANIYKEKEDNGNMNMKVFGKRVNNTKNAHLKYVEEAHEEAKLNTNQA